MRHTCEWCGHKAPLKDFAYNQECPNQKCESFDKNKELVDIECGYCDGTGLGTGDTLCFFCGASGKRTVVREIL